MPDTSDDETSGTQDDVVADAEREVLTSSEADDEIDPVMVTMSFQASDPDGLLGVLSRYVVMARHEPGCRNIDLVASSTKPGRYLMIQKWRDDTSQRRHFDSELMVEMATSCQGLLAAAPDLDLHDAVTMHDLR